MNSGVVAAIHVAGVRGDPCGAVRWTAVQQYICNSNNEMALPFRLQYIGILCEICLCFCCIFLKEFVESVQTTLFLLI